MIIDTMNYGEMECSEADLLHFPDGIFGFTELTKYLLLGYEDSDDSIFILQSAEKPEVSFALLNPVHVCPDYTPVLTPEELSALDADDLEELSYYVICVIRKNYLDNTVNLKCPLVINPVTHKGMQVIMNGTPYGFRHKLGSFSAVDPNVCKKDEEPGSC